METDFAGELRAKEAENIVDRYGGNQSSTRPGAVLRRAVSAGDGR